MSRPKTITLAISMLIFGAVMAVGLGGFATQTVAAANAGNVTGTVTYNGSAVGGATVTLLQNGSQVASTTTATDGTYAFTSVSGGDYTVKVTNTGHNTSETVQATVDGDTIVDVAVESTVRIDTFTTTTTSGELDSIFTELNSTTTTTVTVEAYNTTSGAWEQVSSQSVTPSSTPSAVSVNLSSYSTDTYSKVRIVTDGQEAVDAGVIYQTSSSLVTTFKNPSVLYPAVIGVAVFLFIRQMD